MNELSAPAADDDAPATANRTLAIASLAVLATFLDTTVLFVAFSDIAASYPSVSAAELSWVLNAYTVAVAALLVPAGKLADRLGHKRVFLLGSAAFTAASLACAAAPSAGALVAARGLQAFGAAALVPASFALVLRAFPRHRVPFAMAVWGATGAVAGALGPTLGAALVEAGGWRLVFLINLPVGIGTVAAGARWLHESRSPATKVPAPLGVVLVAGAGALLALGVVQSDTWGWQDARTAAALVGGSVLLVLLVAHQRTTPAPVLDLQLFAIPNFRWANLATLAFSVAFSAMFLGSILFLTTAWQWSILQAGLGVSPGPLLVALVAPRLGSVAGRVGQRPLLLIGGVLFAAGGLWRVVALGPEPDYLVDYLPSMLFTGLGVALCLPQLSSVVGQSLPPTLLGVGGATSQAIRQLGGTFGVALTIALVGRPRPLLDLVAAFDRAWWLLVAGGLITTALAGLLTTRPAGAVAHLSPRGSTTAEPAATTAGLDA